MKNPNIAIYIDTYTHTHSHNSLTHLHEHSTDLELVHGPFWLRNKSEDTVIHHGNDTDSSPCLSQDLCGWEIPEDFTGELFVYI